MEKKKLYSEDQPCLYMLEECRAALGFNIIMEQQGYDYNTHGSCGDCDASDLCIGIDSMITLVDKRDHDSSFYCALASELLTGSNKGHYECDIKETTDRRAVQSGDGTDRIPVEPHGDVY